MNFASSFDTLTPHFIAVGLIGARLLPIAFLCPLLGGQTTPMHVKLGVVLSLSLFLHTAAGITLPTSAVGSLEYAAIAMKEMMLGTTLGLLAALPFDSARMGGRFIDLFRGSSAEASLPFVGSREAASGDVLHTLLVAIATTSGVMPLVLSALFQSYRWAPLGTFAHTDDAALLVASLVGNAFACALAIGAPVAALSLAIDTLLGFASRAASGMNLQETSAPLRILGGGALSWLSLGVIANRLSAEIERVPDLLRSVVQL